MDNYQVVGEMKEPYEMPRTFQRSSETLEMRRDHEEDRPLKEISSGSIEMRREERVLRL